MKIDPNQSSLGQTAEAIPAFQQGFQNTMKMGYEPQDLAADNLKKKVDLSREMNPINYDQIERFSKSQQDQVSNTLGKKELTPGDLINQRVVQAAAQGDPHAVMELSKHNPSSTPQEIVQGAQSGKIGFNDLTLAKEGKGEAQAPQAPQQQAQQAPQQAPQQQQSPNLNDPQFFQKAASVPMSSIPSAGQVDLEKAVLSANRYMAPSIAKQNVADTTNAQKDRHDDKNTDKAVRVANINAHAKMAASGAALSTMDDKEAADTFKATFGALATKPYLNDNEASEVAEKIQILSDPKVKALALTHPAFKAAYTKAYGAPTNFAATATTPTPAGEDREKQAIEHTSQMVSQAVAAKKFTTRIDPVDNTVKPVLPKDVQENLVKGMVKMGMDERKARNFINSKTIKDLPTGVSGGGF